MASWFDTSVKAPQQTDSRLIQMASQSPLQALSQGASELMDIVDNRVKEKYTTSALESLRGVSDTKNYLDALSKIDTTKMSDKGVLALDRLGKNIQLGEQNQRANRQMEIAEANLGMKQDEFQMLKDKQLQSQITNEVLANWDSMNPKQKQDALQYSGLDVLAFNKAQQEKEKYAMDKLLTQAQINKANRVEYDTVYVDGKEKIVPEAQARELVNSGAATTIEPEKLPSEEDIATSRLMSGLASLSTVDKDKYSEQIPLAIDSLLAGEPKAEVDTQALSAISKLTKGDDKLTPQERAINSYMKANPNATYDMAYKATKGTVKEVDSKSTLEKKQMFADKKTNELKQDFGVESVFNIDIAEARKNPDMAHKLNQAVTAELEATPDVNAKKALSEANEAITLSKRLVDNLGVVLREGEKGGNINLAKETWNQYIGKYLNVEFGSAEYKQVKKALSSLWNVKRSEQFGAVLPKQDIQRFEDAVTSLYKSNPDMARGIISMLQDQKQQIDIAKKTLGVKAFYLKYGNTDKNIQTQIDSARLVMGETISSTINGSNYNLRIKNGTKQVQDPSSGSWYKYDDVIKGK